MCILKYLKKEDCLFICHWIYANFPKQTSNHQHLSAFDMNDWNCDFFDK